MGGLDAAAAGINPGRVAELLITPAAPGSGRRGSGYRVSASAVLTAAHVVADAARVQVRFNADRPGEWISDGIVEWSDSTVDAAVVSITPRPEDEGQVTPVAFSRVVERDAVLACSAMGFPRFKLRKDSGKAQGDGSPSQYRDSVHAVGTIAVLSNRRQGTLEVSVPPPERDPDPERSPWEGMSGAAVWSAGRILGLVAEHHRSDGLGRLVATRIDRWYERLSRDQLDQLRTLLPLLPVGAAGLADVVPRSPGELLAAGYIAQVRDIAPEQLLGREQELAELVQFCAGEERYQWWQAGPWAGKSALAAWFVLHPPAGVTVVSFFVTGRLAGQADSDAFTEAMIEQLAAVAGEPATGTAPAGARDRERLRLLELAATRIGEQRERLVLVIDGLDEDEGARPGSGKPSIASLLPKRPPDSVRVLVFSRPSPGVPGDVPGGHPLRHCVPRLLAPSPHAEDVRRAAKQELLDQLHGDQLQVDVIGFITAAGGGLTLTEFAELIRRPLFELEGKLGSVFARSLRTRLAGGRPSSEVAERVYLLAHETLRTLAEEQLANNLDPYRQRILEWADDYRRRGWPARTPRYLLRPYGRLLAASGDLERLTILATDPSRHDRMLVYTYGDAAALAEITSAQQLLLAQPEPDLAALGRLAVYRDRLANRNQGVPRELPAVWARLGQTHRVEALVRSLTDPQAQGWALYVVAKTLAGAGQWDDAEQTARRIADAGIQARALGALAEVQAAVDRDRALALASEAEVMGRSLTNQEARARALVAVVEAVAVVDPERVGTLATEAEQTARSSFNPFQTEAMLHRLARVLAGVGQEDQARRTARLFNHPVPEAWALLALAEGLAAAGQWDRAEQSARSIRDVNARAGWLATVALAQTRALSAVAEALAEVDRDRAIALADEAKQTARTIMDPEFRADALLPVAQAHAAVRRWGRAVQTARSITEPEVKTTALSAVAEALAEVDRDRAIALADEAEQTARSITDPGIGSKALTAVAKALAEVDRERAMTLAAEAEQTVRTIIDLESQTKVLTAVAQALAAGGQWDRAERTAQRIVNHHAQAQALRAIVEALAGAGQWGRAEQTAHGIADGPAKAEAIRALVHALAGAGQWGRAEQAADTITDPTIKTQALTGVAEALAAAEQWDRAEQTARSITDQYARAEAVRAIVDALAGAEHWDRAEQIANTITESGTQTEALCGLAEALIAVDRDRALRLMAAAEQIAAAIEHDEIRDGALCAVMHALLAAEVWDHAEQVAQALPYSKEDSLRGLAEALAAAGQWDRADQTAHMIRDPRIRSQALCGLARLVTDVDRDRALDLVADAEQAARDITDEAAERSPLLPVVQVLVAMGQVDRADHLAGSMTNRYAKDNTLGGLAETLAGAGQWDHAIQTARTIMNTRTQDDALQTVTRTLAAAAQWDRAEQATNSISDPGIQVSANLTIVAALQSAGMPGPTGTGASPGARACRLLAGVLTGGQWLEAIRPLGDLSPPAVLAIDDALHILMP